MNNTLTTVERAVGLDGRIYQLVQKQDGWAVLCDGQTERGIERWFELECATFDQALTFYKERIA